MMTTTNLKFKNHLVAYVDVLGFKNLIMKIKNNPDEQARFLNNYLIKAKNKATEIMGTKSKSDIDLKIQIMSDTFFFSIPCSEYDITDNMAHLAVAVGNLQAYLASIDIWTRGAITFGELILNDGNVVGPALIDAYLMEENSADYPRVIIDPRLYRYFSSREDFLTKVNAITFSNWKGKKIFFQSKEGFFEDYKEAFDDLMFVDYFNGFFNIWIDDNNAVFKALKNIKKNMYSEPSIYRKFVWVHKYFELKRSHLISGHKDWNEREFGFTEEDINMLKAPKSIFQF